eukprot:221370-Ditylum_brightwellii.AAC.1
MRRRLQKISKSFEEYDANPATVYNWTISPFTSSSRGDKEELRTNRSTSSRMRSKQHLNFK